MIAQAPSEAGPSMLGGQKLQYKLDLTCPIAVPARPNGPVFGWPITSEDHGHVDGPSIETIYDEVHDLYLAALFLPEDLLPLTHVTADILALARSLPTSEVSSSLRKCMLALPDIEYRHRKALLPLLAALADGTSSSDIKAARIEDAVSTSRLTPKQLGAVKAAMGLRMGCRAVQEGDGVVVARRVAEELEQREIMLQIILLMTTLSICPPNADESGRTADTETEPKKKRRRRERASSPAPPLRVEPGTQPAEALDLLCDRVAVWMIVAELDTGADSGSSGGDARKKGVAGVVHRFWKHVLHPHFLHLLPSQCASFHLKAFNKPHQPTSTKKPRKPQLTRAKPSSDDIPIVPSRASTYDRAASSSRLSDMAAPARPSTARPRVPSDSLLHNRDRAREPSRSQSQSCLPSRRSSPAASSQHDATLSQSLAPTDMRRSASHTSHRSRSRSMSVDPARQDSLTHDALAEPTRRNSGNTVNMGVSTSASALTRQPSGKDLFKGRQVGLLRRSASGAMRRTASERESGEGGQNQGQPRGLFGRKTSGGSQSQTQGYSQSQSQGQTQTRGKEAEASQSRSETLIMATPSKPRFPDGRRGAHGYDDYYHPTPIAEEPVSERPSRVAETPMAPRIAHTLFGVTQKRKVALIQESPRRSGSFDDGDPFGELMVPTDEEDEGEPDGWAQGVPETPAR